MPKRKISIEEALEALKQHGVRVQPVVDNAQERLDYTEYPPVKKTHDNGMTGYVPEGPVLNRVGQKNIRITLYAAHTVGSGGYMVQSEKGKHVENMGVI